MNKKEVVITLKKEIEKNLQLAMAAAQNTYDIATHEENKAENKYDTRGLEASYLAGAQAKRVFDLKETLQIISTLPIKDFSESSKIALTALVQLQVKPKNLWLFLLPKGGGQSVQVEGQHIQVITPDSPIGQNLIGKEVGDSFDINGRVYEIIETY